MQHAVQNRAPFEVASNRDISGKATASVVNRGLRAGNIARKSLVSYTRHRMKIKMAILALGTFFGLAVALVPLRAQFAYVANQNGTVSAYSIGSNGSLTPVPGSPFAAGAGAISVAVDPTGELAYVANFGDNSVSAYSIGSNGALTPVIGSPFAAGRGPNFVAVDPTGGFAYVANINGNNVSAYSIGSNGSLTPVPGSPFAAGPNPGSLVVDPTGKFIYVTNADNTVSAYSIGSNGALMPVPGSPFAASGFVFSVAVDPTGKFVYVGTFVGNVLAYSIGFNGALTPVPGSPFAAGPAPTRVAVDPTASFVYVANSPPNAFGTVSAYSIGSNGALTPVPGSPVAAGLEPSLPAVDPTGKFVYVTNLLSDNVSAYSIGSNGALTPVPDSPFAAGVAPTSVAITPLVPFATSFAKLKTEARHRPGFELKEFFTLGKNSNGIDPVTENVTLQIGTFSVTIPAGSFEQKPNGRFEFEGVINNVRLGAQIVPLGNNIFTFTAEGKGLDLTDLTNPVTVVLTIGIDSGSTAVTAEFEHRKEHHKQEHARFAPDSPGDNGE
jgi:6-phosphogluconolactonase